MNSNNPIVSRFSVQFTHGLWLCLLMAGAPWSSASTFWTGPATNFTHAAAGGAQDTLVTGSVVITRGVDHGLYNSVTESTATGGVSPQDTAWVMTSSNTAITTYNTLHYGTCPLEQFGSPAQYVNKTFAVHLVAEDVYLSIKITGWGNGADGAGIASFSYTRSTPAVAVPPTVTMTNPVSGTVLAAPVSVKLGASASVSGGTVTNVQFFANGTSLGSVTSSPFNLASAPLSAGTYSLTAVATAGGLSTTSAPVSLSVVTPVATTISSATLAGGNFTFNYNATPMLTYVVQSSSNLTSWHPVITNIPASSPVFVTNTFTTNFSIYYRVARLPNP